MTLGERIVGAREALGLNQKQLAAALGITPTRLNYWEKDKRQPDVPMIKLLAKTLNVTADYLIDNETKKAPGMTPEAEKIAHRYDALDDHGQRVVEIVMEEETQRLHRAGQQEKRQTKIIPLLGASFAAGFGEPDFGNPWEDYEVPAGSPADFAVRITGDSMEPHLKDGSIALGRRETPRDGDVAALLVDGDFLVKQVCEDPYGNVYLFSLNRARADADRTLWASDADAHSLTCFGTIIMDRRIPLP